MTELPKTSKSTAPAKRKDRLADQLRANLQKRKLQTRSRRVGEADTRDEGIAASTKPDGE